MCSSGFRCCPYPLWPKDTFLRLPQFKHHPLAAGPENNRPEPSPTDSETFEFAKAGHRREGETLIATLHYCSPPYFSKRVQNRPWSVRNKHFETPNRPNKVFKLFLCRHDASSREGAISKHQNCALPFSYSRFSPFHIPHFNSRAQLLVWLPLYAGVIGVRLTLATQFA